MPVRVITPPASPVVALADAKKHLRVEHDDDNDYIETLVAAATGWLDGPAGWLGRALGVQVLELIADEFGTCPIALPFPPHISMTSVKYIDAAGVETTIVNTDYELVDGFLRPVWGTSWPSARCQSDAVRIRYQAGNTGNDIPKAIKVAILMLVAQWYETRETVAIGAAVADMPFAVEALLSPYRVYR
jgi:uncharacterized phiE125 gp8 family phage protein